MSLEPRISTIAAPFAADASTNIPTPPVEGVAYRNTALSAANIRQGQSYKTLYDSARYNQVLNQVTDVLMQVERYGFAVHSPLTDYTAGVSIAFGSDGALYVSSQNSGPSYGGSQDPVYTAGYWWTFVEWLAEQGGGGAASLVYPSAFQTFYEQSPPEGWMVRNGALLANARTIVPELYAALQDPANAWKSISEDEWQAMSTAEPWEGVGGVPYFVLDAAANIIRLPDTRGMYMEDAGFDGLAVGGVHGDAMQDLTGQIHLIPNWVGGGTGVFAESYAYGQGTYDSSFPGVMLTFNAALQARTASVNRPRAFGVIGCVYVGKTS